MGRLVVARWVVGVGLICVVAGCGSGADSPGMQMNGVDTTAGVPGASTSGGVPAAGTSGGVPGAGTSGGVSGASTSGDVPVAGAGGGAPAAGTGAGVPSGGPGAPAMTSAPAGSGSAGGSAIMGPASMAGAGSATGNQGSAAPPSTAGGDMPATGDATDVGSGSAGAGSASDGATADGGNDGAPASDGSASAAAPAGPLTPIVRGDDPTETSATRKGPYDVKSYTSGFQVTQYGGGTIWYPADADPPFGAVAICPGFVAVQAQIAGWGPFLASHGIVALTMDTATPLDIVDLRADELMDALNSIKTENDRSDSPLYGKVDTARLGVMGWSMGGGGTWIDAATHPELRTAVTFAGHIITAVNQDITTDMVPTLMFAGSLDNAILGGGMSQPVYDEIPDSTPKMVYEVSGAGHDVANDPSNSGGAIGRYGLSWEKVFLEGDERYRQFLLKMPSNASDFRSNLQ